MFTLMTYDVPSKHVELKKELFALGYTDKFVHEGRYVFLPNTTVYHPTRVCSDAVKDIQGICSRLGIKLERCIAVRTDTWYAIYGEPFK